MTSERGCTKNGCKQVAVATLTFVYADSTAVLGPLARLREPHSYDICAMHAARLTAPRGWDVVRIPATQPPRAVDDLLALANLVREKTVPTNPVPVIAPRPYGSQAHPAGRAGLRARPNLYLVE